MHYAGHVNYWQIDSTLTSLSRRSGVLDPRDKPKFFTCLQFSSSGKTLPKIYVLYPKKVLPAIQLV